jgi:hypothetical protein
VKYNHPTARWWVDQFREGLRARTAFQFADIPQSAPGSKVIFEAQTPTGSGRIILDYWDRPDIESSVAEDCDLYFKMQYSAEGYSHNHILPAGYILPLVRTYLYLPQLRAVSDQKEFEFDVYGRFGMQSHRSGFDVRAKATELLRQEGFRCFSSDMKRVSYRRFMREIAGAQVCIDLPGHGSLCFRLVQYLAVGACVIAYPHTSMLPVPLEEGKNIIYTKPDLSDLVDLCHHYLANPNERDRLAGESRRYFDEHLHRDRLVDRMLTAIEQKLS